MKISFFVIILSVFSCSKEFDGEKKHVSSWKPILEMNENTLYNFHFFDELTGLIFFDSVVDGEISGFIGKTYDGGKNVTIKKGPLQSFFRSSCNFNGQVGLVSNRNILYATYDQGENWEEVKRFKDHLYYYIRDIECTNNGIFYVIDSHNGIYRSVDFCKSFRICKKYNINEEALDLISFIDDIGYVFGYRGAVFKTEDYGDSWQALPDYTEEEPECCQFIDANTGYLCAGYKLLKTTDGANSWTSIASSNNRSDYFSFYIIDDLSGFIIDEEGILWQTLDGWQTRRSILMMDVQYYNGAKLQFLNENLGFTAGLKNLFRYN